MTSNACERNILRKDEYKKGIDKNIMRRKRIEIQNQIRKTNRKNKLSKKRKTSTVLDTSSILDIKIINNIYSKDPNVVLTSLEYIREMSIRDIDIIKTGIVPKLIEFLSYVKYPNHQLETIWILINLTGGSMTNIVIKQGPIILYLLEALKITSNTSLQMDLIWCISNIAVDENEKILQMGGMDIILNKMYINLSSSKLDLKLLITSLHAVLMLLMSKVSHSDKILAIIYKILSSCYKNDKIILKALRCIHILLDNNGYDALFKSGIINHGFITMLNREDKISIKVLQIIGDIISGPDLLTDKIFELGFIQYIPKFLIKNNNFKKEICWIISNISIGTVKQINLMFSKLSINLLKNIIYLLDNSIFNVKKECLYIIDNLSVHNYFIDYLVSYDYIKSISNIFSIIIKNNELTILILQTLKRIVKADIKNIVLIEEVGLFDSINQLYIDTNNKKIVKLCNNFLKEKK